MSVDSKTLAVARAQGAATAKARQQTDMLELKEMLLELKEGQKRTDVAVQELSDQCQRIIYMLEPDCVE